jgi:hypothetical protein
MELSDHIRETVYRLLEIAQFTLQEHKTHIPTAILHAFDGMTPIVLPYENDDHKRALIDFVKEEAVKKDAYAVTVITSSKIEDRRSGLEQECLVLATSLQGGSPYVVVQHFTREHNNDIILFGDLIEGDGAEMPGQMIIFPEWNKEIYH